MKPLFLLLLAVLAAPAAAQHHFDAPWVGYNAGDYDTGRYTVRVLADDFDGDGFPDLVVGRAVWNTGFAFLRSRGDGTHASPVHYASARATWGMATADFDGDGDRDLVTAEFDPQYTTGNTVALFRNHGDGTFAPRVSFPAGPGPVGLAAADLDGDGDADLAVTNYQYLGQGSTVSVLLNDGAGTFAAPVSYPAGAAPWRVAAGDLDGDGDLDLAVANDDFEVHLLFNDGAGAFSAPTALAVPVGGAGLYPDAVLADFDRDGDLDVAYANVRTWDGSTGFIYVLRNDGGGAFAPPVAVPLIPSSAGPVDLAAADLDGDGWADLLGVHYNGRTNDGVVVALNDGAGGFLPAAAYWAGQYTTAMDVADTDRDGDADFVTVDWFSMEATVHENRGDGTFPQAARYEAPPISIFFDLGDVDHDGDLDAFTSGGGASGTNPAVLLNDGAGAFTQAGTYGFGAYGKLRDLDGDGHLDLLFASAPTAPPYGIFTARGRGDGTFGAPVAWPVGSCGIGHLEAVDLDEDGDPDVVSTEYGGCVGVPDSYKRLYVNRNNGDGTFQPAYPVVTEALGPFAVTTADFDGDGHADLAVGYKGAYGANNVLGVLYGAGDGFFREMHYYTVGYGPHDVVAADLDGDGDPDLASGNAGYGAEGQETTSFLRNTGAGFAEAATYYAPRSPDLLGVTGIAAGDADGDGDLDLLVSNAGSNDAAFYENDGGGHFTFTYRYGIGGDASDVHFADVTGDGRPDLAALIGLRPGGFPSALAVVPGLAGQTAPVIVSAEPVGGPITIGPGGGSFRFRVALTNTTDQTQTVQAWSAVTGPADREPVMGPMTVTIPPGATVAKTLRQRVPGAAPAGSYTYHVRVGTFGGTVVASDSFPFEKAAGATAAQGGEAASDWSVSGVERWEGAESASASLPGGFALSEAAPNPSAGRVTLTLEVAAAQRVRAEVYDGLGRRVAVLADGAVEAGQHGLVLDGAPLPAGVYVVRVVGEGFTVTRRLTLVR